MPVSGSVWMSRVTVTIHWFYTFMEELRFPLGATKGCETRAISWDSDETTVLRCSCSQDWASTLRHWGSPWEWSPVHSEEPVFLTWWGFRGWLCSLLLPFAVDRLPIHAGRYAQPGRGTRPYLYGYSCVQIRFCSRGCDKISFLPGAFTQPKKAP